MRVLIVSGIWPPDVGGPASHAPEVAEALFARGHVVEVVTTAAAPPPSGHISVRFVSRGLLSGLRHIAVVALVARRSRRVDVVYATSMVGRSTLATAVSRTPLVVKLGGDPAFERARRRGLFAGVLPEFHDARLGRRAELLRRWRTITMRRSAHVFCPSEFLRAIVLTWGLPPRRVSVLRNAAPPVPALPTREALRSSLGIDGPTLAFVGRLTRAKALEVTFAAVAEVEGVSLLVVGDGEERAMLEDLAGPRIRFLGSLPRERVLEVMAASDAVILSSAWENFPHALVEGLAVGTPVIATRVGGVPEIVEEEVNGLLVPPGDPLALAAAIRRFFADDGLRARLTAGAAPSVRKFSLDSMIDRLEGKLAEIVRTPS
jgi:glycosyltransferase involved in cell wall biosynthesis